MKMLRQVTNVDMVLCGCLLEAFWTQLPKQSRQCFILKITEIHLDILICPTINFCIQLLSRHLSSKVGSISFLTELFCWMINHLGPPFVCWISGVVPFNMWPISSWEENNCCYKLINWQNDNYLVSKWHLRPFWVK